MHQPHLKLYFQYTANFARRKLDAQSWPVEIGKQFGTPSPNKCGLGKTCTLATLVKYGIKPIPDKMRAPILLKVLKK